jgi:hypothetical protein
MTVIEEKPRKWGWCVFESPGVEPLFLEKRQAIDYAPCRERLLSGPSFLFALKQVAPGAVNTRGAICFWF